MTPVVDFSALISGFHVGDGRPGAPGTPERVCEEGILAPVMVELDVVITDAHSLPRPAISAHPQGGT